MRRVQRVDGVEATRRKILISTQAPTVILKAMPLCGPVVATMVTARGPAIGFAAGHSCRSASLAFETCACQSVAARLGRVASMAWEPDAIAATR